MFGTPSQKDVSSLHMLAICDLLDVRLTWAYYYSRFIVDGILYHSDASNRLEMRNNSTVQLQDGKVCSILNLVTSEHSNNPKTCCVLVRELVKTGRQMCRDTRLKIGSRFVFEVSETNIVYAVHADSLKCKCVRVDSKDKVYVIPLPNNVERD